MMDSPTLLRVTQEALDAMITHFRSELPREGCGFLAGREGIAHRFYAIHNTTPELRRFSMDPRHVQRTEISIHRRSQRILAVCHSHPEGEAYPSQWDVVGAFFDPALSLPLWMEEAQVIVGLEPPGPPDCRAFVIQKKGRIEEIPIEIVPTPPVERLTATNR